MHAPSETTYRNTVHVVHLLPLVELKGTIGSINFMLTNQIATASAARMIIHTSSKERRNDSGPLFGHGRS